MVGSVGRIFVAVDLGVETRAALAAQLREVSIPGKPVPPQNWHLTLRYLGDIDEVAFDRVLAGLDQADLGAAFRVSFTGLGAFPRPRRATVLWRDVDDTAGRLHALAGVVEEACRGAGVAAEDRPFRPHLTLSRIRPDGDVRSVIANVLKPVPAGVDAITVFRSHLGGPHARYEELDRVSLR